MHLQLYKSKRINNKKQIIKIIIIIILLNKYKKIALVDTIKSEIKGPVTKAIKNITK